MKDTQLRKNERQLSTSTLATTRQRSPDWVRNLTRHSNEYKRWKLILKPARMTSSPS
ncbi:hypothetical protein Hanom_Chr15g01379431 [Helianthus anomalus]